MDGGADLKTMQGDRERAERADGMRDREVYGPGSGGRGLSDREGEVREGELAREGGGRGGRECEREEGEVAGNARGRRERAEREDGGVDLKTMKGDRERAERADEMRDREVYGPGSGGRGLSDHEGEVREGELEREGGGRGGRERERKPGEGGESGRNEGSGALWARVGRQGIV